MKHITTEDLKQITTEGLVLQGCGGDPQEWLNGINEMLTEAGILRDGDVFKDISVFEHDGHTNILFNMEDVKLDIGKLAMWRLQNHSNFGGTWLSDYLPNRLGVEMKGLESDGADIGINDEPEEKAPPIVAFGERPSPYRDGNADGPHESDVENSKTAHPIRVYIENVHDESIGGFTIPLPARLAELQGFLEASEITGWQDTEILQVRLDITGLEKILTETIKKTMSQEMLDELNYLAAKIEGMNNNEYEVFTSALEAKRHCGSVAELINLTENLNRFELQPAFNAAMLGEHLVDGDADNYSAGLQKLYDSEDEELRGVINYIETLEKYVDYSAYGKEYADNEQGVFTENGYLTESGEFQEVYRGSVDIPDDYRIFTEPGVAYKPPMKLDGEDIAETLVKIHAVCCVNLNGAAEELKALSKVQDTDYILMVNKDRTFITPAVEAYKRGEIPEKTINHWAQMPGTSFFALRVMDRGDNNGRGMTGDFVELNTQALLSNISLHSATPDRIEAFKHDGYSKSYDFAAWEELSKTPQYEIKSFKAYFPDDDLEYAANRFASFMGANEMSSEAVSVDTFLSVMNAAYMADAENPQPDMLRITNEAAKQILARGDTDVFKLTPAGAEKLASIEAMRQLSFAQIRDVAIKREDISALDKWAKSAVKDLQRQNGRDERKTAKNKGEEL